MVRRFFHRVFLLLLLLVFLVIILWDAVVFIVPNGFGAVNWNPVRPWVNDTAVRFQLGEAATAVGEGVHIIPPWNQFFHYDLRMQAMKHTYKVVSVEGLHFEVDMTFRWRVSSQNLVRLNKQYGQDYLNTMLIPEIGSQLRKIASIYPAEALYTQERGSVQDKVYEAITSESNLSHVGVPPKNRRDPDPHTIFLFDTLISSIRLPAKLQNAIESKLAESELVEQYQFRVEREKLESRRKAEEAKGIKKFQETVVSSITEGYLRWRGIEATLELAKSNNSKVVVIGGGELGLPIILGGLDGKLPLGLDESSATSDSGVAGRAASRPQNSNAADKNEARGDNVSVKGSSSGKQSPVSSVQNSNVSDKKEAQGDNVRVKGSSSGKPKPFSSPQNKNAPDKKEAQGGDVAVNGSSPGKPNP